MKTAVQLLLLLMLAATPSYAQTFLYREKTDLANNYEKGEVTIDLANTTLHQNETATIRYTFHATGGSYAVYNWQFSRLKQLPGQLVIYDENKQYIGDLIAFTGGSQATVSDEDWTFLYSEAFVGKPLSFRAGSVPNTKYDFGGGLLPGTYYIQLVLYKAFLSPNPFRLSGDPYDFYGKFDKSELCRSNVIKISIVAR